MYLAYSSSLGRIPILFTQIGVPDTLCLHYGLHPLHLTDQCPCGESFSIDHSMSCPTGGFPTIRHNEERDLFAAMFTKVCHDIETEPFLQPLSGEILPQRCNTREDEARLDNSACCFWGGRFQKMFSDVRIFNPNASSYKSNAISSCYKNQEKEKKRKYEDCIRRVEQASFTPLILSCTGGASQLTTTFIKRLASQLSEKKDRTYSTTIC